MGDLHKFYDLALLEHSEGDPEAAKSRYIASKNQLTKFPAEVGIFESAGKTDSMQMLFISCGELSPRVQ
jgi:hypothetical protein